MTGMMMMTRRGDDESRRATRPVGFFWFLVFERLNPATRCCEMSKLLMQCNRSLIAARYKWQPLSKGMNKRFRRCTHIHYARDSRIQLERN
jgi:hypothetical protein